MYNYKITYLTDGLTPGKKTITNSYSIPLERALDDIREALTDIEEINATVIDIKLMSVKFWIVIFKIKR